MFRQIVSSRRFRLLLPWISAAILLAGIGAVLGVYFSNTAPKLQVAPTGPPVHFKPKPNAVPLPNAARHVAGEFILTAVARKHLAEAYRLAHPILRAGSTRKQWLSGNIPVVPYPVVSTASFKVDYSYPDQAQIELYLIPKKGSKIKPQQFLMGLRMYGKGSHRHWTVDLWQPLGGPPIPTPA
jgi:hypothetical protein